MKYIVRYHNNEYDDCPMYMIAHQEWTPKLLWATTHSENEQAANLVQGQYIFTHKAWDHMTILKYTDQEYFKAILKG